MTTLILQLNSMELGLPPLYTVVNKVCRTMDSKLLSTLGPFIKCLSMICQKAEENKEKVYRMRNGYKVGGGFWGNKGKKGKL